MLAFDVRHLELGIVTALTAALAVVAIPRATPPRAMAGTPAMPAQTPEAVIVGDSQTAAVACNAEGVTTVVFKGAIHALDPDARATFHFRFADLPSRYSVMTGANGAFEVRIPREELGVVDLCTLPSSGTRPASFRDDTMTIAYELTFER